LTLSVYPAKNRKKGKKKKRFFKVEKNKKIFFFYPLQLLVSTIQVLPCCFECLEQNHPHLQRLLHLLWFGKNKIII